MAKSYAVANAERALVNFKEWYHRITTKIPRIKDAMCQLNLDVPFVRWNGNIPQNSYACKRCGVCKRLSDLKTAPCKARQGGASTRPDKGKNKNTITNFQYRKWTSGAVRADKWRGNITRKRALTLKTPAARLANKERCKRRCHASKGKASS